MFGPAEIPENDSGESQLINNQPLAQIDSFDGSFIEEFAHIPRHGGGIASPGAIEDVIWDHEISFFKRSQTSTTFSRELKAEMRK